MEVVHADIDMCQCCSFLANSIRQIPSPEFRSVEVQAKQVTISALEDLLDQLQSLKQAETCINVKTERLKGVRITAIANASEIVKKDLSKLFEVMYAKTGRQLQIKFKHRKSKK